MKNIIQHGLDNLAEVAPDATHGSDLHYYLYNEDYFIIGTREATEWLEQYGTFRAIQEITDYEKGNFGEVSTDLSDPEKVVNMLAYILGEEALQKCDTLRECWDKLLTAKYLKKIAKELKEQL
jgi:hypothetical protein